jgi:hypothetical protein
VTQNRHIVWHPACVAASSDGSAFVKH